MLKYKLWNIEVQNSGMLWWDEKEQQFLCRAEAAEQQKDYSFLLWNDIKNWALKLKSDDT